MNGKYAKLIELLRSMHGVVVAYSGGADSTLLLAAAHEALGEQVLAVTAHSPALPEDEGKEAERIARSLGARHIAIETPELELPEYRRNQPDRCYHCKRLLFQMLREIANHEGFAEVIEGSNSDDLRDYRPGRGAIAELGIRSPLVEVGLTKDEIRHLSRAKELPTWNKPARACLASRVPYGEEITAERLSRIDRAERLIRELGARQVRVRDHGPLARVEVAPDEIERIVADDVRERLASGLKALGWTFVTLDLEGYRVGSLNELRLQMPGKRVGPVSENRLNQS